MALTSISITPQFGNNTVTAINCGTSSPKLGGTIDISAFPNLQQFTCNNNDITAITGYVDNSNLKLVSFINNKVTGSIPSLSALAAIREFFCANNLLTGSIPNLSSNVELFDFYCTDNLLTGFIPSFSANTKLRLFRCNNNQLTGSIPSLSANRQLLTFYCDNNQLTGSIPNLSANAQLASFFCQSNDLTGSIPSLSANRQLALFYCNDNLLTGSIPNLSANAQLRVFYCDNNQLTGSIPTLSANTKLEQFRCGVNQLNNFGGGSVSNTLGDFQAQSNLLTQPAVNAILAAFVAANKTTGTRNLLLAGTGNASPTGGISNPDRLTLVSRGWTVQVN